MSMTIDYTLSQSELPAIRDLVKFQGTFNHNRITYTTTGDIAGYFEALSQLSSSYGAVANGTWKAWYDQIFSALTTTDDLARICVIHQYASWLGKHPFDSWWPLHDCQLSLWHIYRQGFDWHPSTPPLQVVREFFGPGIRIPIGPEIWQKSIQDLIAAWGDNPPKEIIKVGPKIENRQECEAFERSVLNDSAEFPRIIAKTKTVWKSQLLVLSLLLREKSCAVDCYPFLSFLLLALVAGSPVEQTLAQEIVNAPTASREHPNDLFINQLLYLTLLDWIDPLGSYRWNSSQLKQALVDLQNVILLNDPASTVIRTTLKRYENIIRADPGYPLHDPYNAAVGFAQRKADTLQALDEARVALSKTLNPEVPQ